MTFAEFLRKHRDRVNLTQWQYADAAGLSRSVLSCIELGTRTPPLDKLADMAKPLLLTGRDRKEFVYLATFAHIPDETARENAYEIVSWALNTQARLQRMDMLLDQDSIAMEEGDEKSASGFGLKDWIGRVRGRGHGGPSLPH